MMRPGYNPTRRNRNIGTENAGFGQNNRLVIPNKFTVNGSNLSVYYENLVNPVDIAITVHAHKIHVLVEPTLKEFAHACSIEDIILLLSMMPEKHVKHIKIIVFRQPKRKEIILSPVWGRLAFHSDIGTHSGPAIYIEAQKINQTIRWRRSMTPNLADEFERLREDGHSISHDKRFYYIASSLQSVRNTQLYRTLPHEIGHYVDYTQSVHEASGDDCEKWLALNDRYDQKPSMEKETFAHRYADNFRGEMTTGGKMPFDRIIDEKKMEKQGLKPEWFGLSKLHHCDED